LLSLFAGLNASCGCTALNAAIYLFLLDLVKALPKIVKATREGTVFRAAILAVVEKTTWEFYQYCN